MEPTGLTQSLIDYVENFPQLAHLCYSIVHGAITSKGFNRDSEQGSWWKNNQAWVRVCRLNKSAIVRFVKYLNCYNYYSTNYNRSKYLSLFNKYGCKDGTYSRRRFEASDILYCGINIYKDLKITGYHFNICDFTGQFMTNGNVSYEDFTRFLMKIYKVIYIGDKNYFLGFIDNEAIMYLDEVLLDKIRQFNQDTYNELVKRIFSVYANANSIFFDLHTDNIEDLLCNRLRKYMTTQVLSTDDEVTVVPPDHIDLFEDYNMVTALTDKMENSLRKIVKNVLEGTTWGINSQYSFKKLIDEMYREENKKNDKKVEEAFNKGMLFGNKVETCGWTISDETYDDCVTWEKEVDIVPVRFYYKNECYRINNDDPNWKNPFKITKLFVNAKGSMRCQGFHPNTNNGNVCMGDISGKIVMSDIKKLQQNLTRCESLLYTINYDSPYDSSRREELMAHSVKEGSDGYNDDDKFVSTGHIIQEIDFEDEQETSIDPDVQPVPDDSIQLEVIGND